MFFTCPPHFCCTFTILADVRKNRLLYVGKCWKCCKNPPCFPTHILWIKIFLTMDFDFLRYRGLQGTHMDAWKPSGIFWTKFVDLQQCAPPPLISCSSQLFIAKGLATVCPDWFITTRGNCNWLLQQYNLEKLFFSTDSLQTKKKLRQKTRMPWTNNSPVHFFAALDNKNSHEFYNKYG